MVRLLPFIRVFNVSPKATLYGIYRILTGRYPARTKNTAHFGTYSHMPGDKILKRYGKWNLGREGSWLQSHGRFARVVGKINLACQVE